MKNDVTRNQPYDHRKPTADFAEGTIQRDEQEPGNKANEKRSQQVRANGPQTGQRHSIGDVIDDPIMAESLYQCLGQAVDVKDTGRVADLLHIYWIHTAPAHG